MSAPITTTINMERQPGLAGIGLSPIIELPGPSEEIKAAFPMQLFHMEVRTATPAGAIRGGFYMQSRFTSALSDSAKEQFEREIDDFLRRQSMKLEHSARALHVQLSRGDVEALATTADPTARIETSLGLDLKEPVRLFRNGCIVTVDSLEDKLKVLTEHPGVAVCTRNMSKSWRYIRERTKGVINWDRFEAQRSKHTTGQPGLPPPIHRNRRDIQDDREDAERRNRRPDLSRVDEEEERAAMLALDAAMFDLMLRRKRQ